MGNRYDIAEAIDRGMAKAGMMEDRRLGGDAEQWDYLAHLMVSEARRHYPETANQKSGRQMANLKHVRATFFGYGYSVQDIKAIGKFIDEEGL